MSEYFLVPVDVADNSNSVFELLSANTKLNNPIKLVFVWDVDEHALIIDPRVIFKKHALQKLQKIRAAYPNLEIIQPRISEAPIVLLSEMELIHFANELKNCSVLIASNLLSTSVGHLSRFANNVSAQIEKSSFLIAKKSNGYSVEQSIFAKEEHAGMLSDLRGN